MKAYNVEFHYEEYGTAEVHANSKKEAENTLYDLLDEEGIQGMRNYKCNGREYFTQDAKEIKKGVAK